MITQKFRHLNCTHLQMDHSQRQTCYLHICKNYLHKVYPIKWACSRHFCFTYIFTTYFIWKQLLNQFNLSWNDQLGYLVTGSKTFDRKQNKNSEKNKTKQWWEKEMFESLNTWNSTGILFMMDLYIFFPNNVSRTAFIHFFLLLERYDYMLFWISSVCDHNTIFPLFMSPHLAPHFTTFFFQPVLHNWFSAIKDYITCANNATSCRQARVSHCNYACNM